MTIRQDWDDLGTREVARLDTEFSGLRFDVCHMPVGKRAFDITLALVLLVPLAFVMAMVAVVLAVRQGRPILYAAPRMKGPDRMFLHLKFRTMLEEENDSGVTGAHKTWRITPLGQFLRRTRLDELPQLFNILRGDMIRARGHVTSSAPGTAEVFNLCTGRSTTLLDLARMIDSLSGQPAAPRRHLESQPGDIRMSLGCPVAARETLGFVSEIDMREGLAEIWSGMARGRLHSPPPPSNGSSG